MMFNFFPGQIVNVSKHDIMMLQVGVIHSTFDVTCDVGCGAWNGVDCESSH